MLSLFYFVQFYSFIYWFKMKANIHLIPSTTAAAKNHWVVEYQFWIQSGGNEKHFKQKHHLPKFKVWRVHSCDTDVNYVAVHVSTSGLIITAAKAVKYKCSWERGGWLLTEKLNNQKSWNENHIFHIAWMWNNKIHLMFNLFGAFQPFMPSLSINLTWGERLD